MFNEEIVNSDYAMNMIAMQLKAMGVKRGLIKELTGVSEATIKRHTGRIFPDKSDRPAQPKGVNITQEWFFSDISRLDQGCIALLLYKDYSKKNNKALAIIKTFHSYEEVAANPILSINHVIMLTQFLNSGKIHIDTCSKCHHNFILKTDEVKINCPHCFKQ